ncbi:MAG: pyridoxal phosphate-dependent aminotransferase [Chitinivibrionales bacterium]|nr:pyridoxal phosphate-dependent aminotransferase [Chitinivibrionales bacterium]
MTISATIKESFKSASFIRRMFEVGIELKRLYGEQNVFDFTIGNPNVEPPQEFQEALKSVIEERVPLKHGYMQNAGYTDVRTAVAHQVSAEHGITLPMEHIVMTCGAGGALNCILKTVCNPSDQVIGIAPYFVEYSFYASNHGARFVPVASQPDFDIDLDALAAALSPKTAAVLINSPNNPTGKIYPPKTLEKLGALLESKSKIFGRTIYLVSDEPYRAIVYETATKVPSVFRYYRNSIVATSYSKGLSIPGERIGYIAVGMVDDAEDILNGIILCNRILGYINAPAIMQRTIKRIQGISSDISIYRKNRNYFCDALITMGYELIKPDGTFYLFPKAPGGDDVAFVAELQKEHILTVPGSGFGTPGHFHIAFCCSFDTVERSMPGFQNAITRVSKETGQ